MAFVAFQAMFATITVALIAGAIADRAKFGVWLVFGAIWATLVYFPGRALGVGGRRLDLRRCGPAQRHSAIDFAGGTAVHINAGAAGLALCIVLGKRLGWPRPHEAAQPDAGHDRRRPAVVRLVRLQRRIGARCQATHRPWCS